MRTTNFVRFLQQDSQATWFCMDIVDYNALAEHGSVYDLAGAAKRSDDSLNTDKGSRRFCTLCSTCAAMCGLWI